MIQVYKIVHNHYDKISFNDLITFKTDCRLRGHDFTEKKLINRCPQITSLIKLLIIVNADSINRKKYNKKAISTR